MFKKGFTVSLIIIVFAILAYFFGSQIISKDADQEEVKGASTVKEYKNGIGLTVNSKGTWDLREYLCEDRKCAESGTTGRLYKTTSGGEAENFEVALEYTRGDFSTYEYLKILVKPGWGFVNETYSIEQGSNFESIGAEIYINPDSGTRVLLIPLKNVLNTHTSNVASFSN